MALNKLSTILSESHEDQIIYKAITICSLFIFQIDRLKRGKLKIEEEKNRNLQPEQSFSEGRAKTHRPTFSHFHFLNRSLLMLD